MKKSTKSKGAARGANISSLAQLRGAVAGLAQVKPPEPGKEKPKANPKKRNG
jgi:hypothetical protein